MASFPHDNKTPTLPTIIPLWQQQAQQWARVRPPLRPSAADLVFAQNEIDRHASRDRPMNTLILGATPELLDLHWPASSRVLAVDLSGPMIRALWGDRSKPHHWPAQGD